MFKIQTLENLKYLLDRNFENLSQRDKSLKIKRQKRQNHDKKDVVLISGPKKKRPRVASRVTQTSRQVQKIFSHPNIFRTFVARRVTRSLASGTSRQWNSYF